MPFSKSWHADCQSVMHSCIFFEKILLAPKLAPKIAPKICLIMIANFKLQNLWKGEKKGSIAFRFTTAHTDFFAVKTDADTNMAAIVVTLDCHMLFKRCFNISSASSDVCYATKPPQSKCIGFVCEWFLLVLLLWVLSVSVVIGVVCFSCLVSASAFAWCLSFAIRIVNIGRSTLYKKVSVNLSTLIKTSVNKRLFRGTGDFLW